MNLKWIILPDNPWKVLWDLLMIMPLIYTCLVTPVDVAFYDTMPDWLVVCNTITDTFFSLDIIITFFSAYFHNDTLITDKSTIAKNYLLGWFTIDVLGIFPFSYIFQGSSFNKMIRIIRIQRLYKVFRLNKLKRIFFVIKSMKDNFKILSKYKMRIIRVYLLDVQNRALIPSTGDIPIFNCDVLP